MKQACDLKSVTLPSHLTHLTEPSKESSVFHATGARDLIDDPQLSRTLNYTATVDLLRLQYNALVKVIETWERFEDAELQYFLGIEHETLRYVWDGYIAGIERSANELRSLRTILQQKIETFNNMRHGVSILFGGGN